MEIHPPCFALYQSGFAILGLSENVDALLEDAETWLAMPPCLAADGRMLTPRDVYDWSRVETSHGDIPGELYVRRCTPALAALVQRYGPTPFTLRQDGVLDEA